MSDSTDLDAAAARIRAWGKANPTPALVIVREALEHNIAAIAQAVLGRGVALRPHAKTHKCLKIAQLQMAAGASGLCCAKLSEAEAFRGAGFAGSILITSPIVGAEACARLARLNRESGGAIMVVVDNPAGAAMIAAAIGDGAPLEALIDVDPGIRRTGVATAEEAVALAYAMDAYPQIRLRGVQFYCGLQQHISDVGDRAAATVERSKYLKTVLLALSGSGYRIEIVSGSGTGTLCADLAGGVFSEVQVGSAIFLDRQYTDCVGVADAFGLKQSLFLAARVISCNTPGLATLDAGYKAMASDAGPPAILSGPHAGARLIFMGDEHCAVISAAQPFCLGEIVVLQPPHCDPTVNLYDAFTVLSVTEGAVHSWPITARGCVR
jgi:D-serine deaminase-like pyridoxal phosphate-dependent protein